MVTIRLTNSMTHRKEAFVPLDAGNVRMYVCGPTVYDRAHLGNARPVVVFDVLYRLLRHVYGAEHVTYVRNFTDVDDKINAKAAETGRDIREITDETIGWYHADMDALGALRPDHEPRATEYIGAMISMIETLIRKGFAYTAPISYGHNSKAVYFNSEKAPEHGFFRVESDEDYGKLSGRSLDDMISGAKAEIGEGKRNPMDFVLWKPSTVDEPGWESPWGMGRPGWHIECSAMAKALLGDLFDIHAGGLDLQFPHHENEIAQSCCANGTDEMAQVWLHNEMLLVEGKKMSKSLGNFFTVRDLLEQGVPGEVIRFVLLSTHYRSPMDWTAEKAQIARNHLRRWWELLGPIEFHPDPTEPTAAFLASLSNDLDSAGAIAEILKLENQGRIEEFASCVKMLGFLYSDEARLKIMTENNLSEAIRDKINSLVRVWIEARRQKRWDYADDLSRNMKILGVQLIALRDNGSDWKHINPDYMGDDSQADLSAKLDKLLEVFK
ncbi:cysteine--tRNA ligase [Tabrizicola sp. WMC-M-20]|nr:cysteine--tRNA ligase [Tabrizicola sp. WMC-M-20]